MAGNEGPVHRLAASRGGRPLNLAQGQIDGGATAWLLTSTALVLLMTPGVAFFYGGMVRQKNVLGMIMQSFATIGIVSIVWVALGFSLAFGPGRWIGDLSFAGLTDPDAHVP